MIASGVTQFIRSARRHRLPPKESREAEPSCTFGKYHRKLSKAAQLLAAAAADLRDIGPHSDVDSV